MLERVVFTALLSVLHLVYAAYCAVRDSVCMVPLWVAWADDAAVPAAAAQGPVPKHLAIVFPLVHETEVGETAWAQHNARRHALIRKDAFEDVFCLARWCALSSIPELTVYDQQGVLRQAFAHAYTHPAGWPVPYAPSAHASVECAFHLGDGAADVRVFSRSLGMSPHAWRAYEQYGSDATVLPVRVNVISARDDKPALVRAARQLAPPIDVPTLRAAVREEQVLSCDPDLVIVCGQGARPIQLYGFPCWNIRLADLRCVSSLTQHAPVLDLAWPLDSAPVSRGASPLCTHRAAVRYIDYMSLPVNEVGISRGSRSLLRSNR